VIAALFMAVWAIFGDAGPAAPPSIPANTERNSA
jgi:hypothetical protein